MKKPQWLRLLKRLVLYPLALITAFAVLGSVYYIATLYRAGAPHKGELALTGATVLVGEKLEPLSGTTVLIRDGIIVEVGADMAVTIPAEATILNLDGFTLMPGLVDLHVHLGSTELEKGETVGLAQLPGIYLDAIRFVPGNRRALLEHGVTTVRSVGDDEEWIMELRHLLRDGELEGPRLFAAGPLFTAPGGHPVATLFANEPTPNEQIVRLPSSTDEARLLVRELAEGPNRVDLIKVVHDRGRPERSFPLETIKPDVLNALVDEAHRQRLPVFAHWGTQQDLEELLAADVDGLEHVGRLLAGWPDALLASVVERDISMTPTLAVMAVKLPPSAMQIFQNLVADFHAAGGRVVVGSDAGMPGVPFGGGVHRELELLVESGLTPHEALRAATSEAAQVIGTDHIGAIMPGRAADLLVVDGDPLLEIGATRNVVIVFRDGRLVVDRRGEDGTP